MRILNLQNAVLVSLAVAGAGFSLGLGACSSSDAPNRGGDAGAPGGGAANGGAPPVNGGAGGTVASAGAGGAAGPSVCDGLGTKVFAAPDNAFVDDFECATAADCWAAADAPQPANIRKGWSTFNDLGAPGADAADNMLFFKQIAGGAATTAHGGQYAGAMVNPSTVAPGFGAGSVFNIVVDKVAGIFCADISAFDGISFWAKSAMLDKVEVKFVLPSTQAVMDGGDCKTGCYLHPSAPVTLTADWFHYSIPFPATVKTKNLVQLIGFFPGNAPVAGKVAWDFSLDEIAFYKGTAPEGPVAPVVTAP